MACLAREVKDEVPTTDEMREAVAISDVGDIHGHGVFNALDVREAATVLRPQGIDEHDAAAGCDQRAGQVRTDESEPTCDEDPLPLEDVGKLGSNQLSDQVR
jgi:hypothetical protein